MKYGEDFILIDNGDTFAGNWFQLADCFGITNLNSLKIFCKQMDSKYTIQEFTKESEKLLKLR